MVDRISPPLAGALETVNEGFLEFLRILAHRLSQPLTCLQGSVEVALMGQLEESECRRVLELSLQEAARIADALEILRDVLEMESSDEPVQSVCWTRKVKELLEETASADRNCAPQLAFYVQEDVWVNASPQHLDSATTMLIAGATRAARCNRVVRINLSACAESACLLVSEEAPSVDLEAGTASPPGDRKTQVLGTLDLWVVRRAIERQGGRLRVVQDSQTCCYQLSIPLTMSEITGKLLP